MIFLIFLWMIVSTCESAKDDDLLIRKLDAGLLRGRKHLTPSGVEGIVFLSIPVAEPPIGNLRYRKAIPRKAWDGILDATNYTVSCFWNATKPVEPLSWFNFSEDCIRLNIFTNEHCLTGGDCPVVVYIHGGNLNHGTPVIFNQDTIVDNYNNKSRNVIMVTSSHRQSSFGLLNLNWRLNLSLDLNCGFQDIIFQLEWIQKNIHIFGGNASRVTLMGHSAGGTTADLLNLSPKTRGLFQQLILMSTPANFPHLVRDKNQKASRNTAKNVGCVDFDVNDPRWNDFAVVEGVVECLRNKPAMEVSTVQLDREVDGFLFQSVARDDQKGSDSVLPGSYLELNQQRKPLPTIIGTLTKEFMHSAATVAGAFTVAPGPLYLWCRDAIIHRGFNATGQSIEKCMTWYNSTSRSFNIYDDVEIFLPGMYIAESILAKGAPVFIFKFGYNEIGAAYMSHPGSPPQIREKTPSHTMDMPYIIGERVGIFTEKDKQIQFLYSQVLVDFINHGTPNTENRPWEVYNPEIKNHFYIDFPDPTLECPGLRWHYHSEAYQFWNQDFPRTAEPIPEAETEDDLVVTMMNIKEYSREDGPDFMKKKPETNWNLLFWISFLSLIFLVFIFFGKFLIRFATRKNEYQRI